MADHRDDDRRVGERLLCEPHNGSRTTEWLRFERDFSVATDAIFMHEDDYSIWQALTDLDQGGGSREMQNGHDVCTSREGWRYRLRGRKQ